MSAWFKRNLNNISFATIATIFVMGVQFYVSNEIEKHKIKLNIKNNAKQIQINQRADSIANNMTLRLVQTVEAKVDSSDNRNFKEHLSIQTALKNLTIASRRSSDAVKEYLDEIRDYEDLSYE